MYFTDIMQLTHCDLETPYDGMELQVNPGPFNGLGLAGAVRLIMVGITGQ